MRRRQTPEEIEAEEQRKRQEQERRAEIGHGLRREIAVAVSTAGPMPSRAYLKMRLRCDLASLDGVTKELIAADSVEVENHADGLRWRARFRRNGEWMPWTDWGNR